MKIKPSTKRRIRRFWKRIVQLLWISLKTVPWVILVGLILLIAFWAIWPQVAPPRTGFGEYLPQTSNAQANLPMPERAKTLWDWMELLLVPFSLSLVAVWINHSLQNREKAKAEDQLLERALQEYFKEISNLLLSNDLYLAKRNDDVRFIAIAHSSNILERLDGQRKGVVLKFLRSLDLITCSISPDWKITQTTDKPKPVIALTQLI